MHPTHSPNPAPQNHRPPTLLLQPALPMSPHPPPSSPNIPPRLLLRIFPYIPPELLHFTLFPGLRLEFEARDADAFGHLPADGFGVAGGAHGGFLGLGLGLGLGVGWWWWLLLVVVVVGVGGGFCGGGGGCGLGCGGGGEELGESCGFFVRFCLLWVGREMTDFLALWPAYSMCVC